MSRRRFTKRVKRGLAELLSMGWADVETGQSDEVPRFTAKEEGDMEAAMAWARSVGCWNAALEQMDRNNARKAAGKGKR